MSRAIAAVAIHDGEVPERSAPPDPAPSVSRRVVIPMRPASRPPASAADHTRIGRNRERIEGMIDWRRRADSNRRITDLQSAALPLGYGAILLSSARIVAHLATARHLRTVDGDVGEGSIC